MRRSSCELPADGKMAGIAQLLATLFLFFFSSATVFAAPQSKLLGLQKTEKLSHIRLYWHDILAGKKPSAVQILPPINSNASSFFGLVRMMDNPLTAGPDLRSKLWGRAQGLYAVASQENLSLLMAMNFEFVSGKYNGSSITILGRNSIGEKVREMPVIGGSGAFRFARGFAKLRTVKINSTYAVAQYDLYILHY